jgi:Putative zinc-RING and/or ribbon
LTSFFRIEKNYDVCKFTGSLMCRRWCHLGDRRVLPHRLVLEWDDKQYRVCRAVADFLDDIHIQPIINIEQVNPLLFDGVPALHQVRLFRKSIATLVDKAMSKPSTAPLAASVLNGVLGSDRLHLSLCSNFYSMRDLCSVAKGEMIAVLYDAYDNLRLIVPKRPKMPSDQISAGDKAFS